MTTKTKTIRGLIKRVFRIETKIENNEIKFEIKSSIRPDSDISDSLSESLKQKIVSDQIDNITKNESFIKLVDSK